MDALELPRDPATGPHESGFRVDPFLEYDQSPLPETIDSLSVVPQPTGLLQPGYCRLSLARADHSVPDDSLDICTRWSYCGAPTIVRKCARHGNSGTARAHRKTRKARGRMWGVCGGC